MKIVVAVDSFKGSASATEIAETVGNGILKVNKNIDIIKLPIADGGEGTVEILHKILGGSIRRKTVTGPLGKPIDAVYGVLPNGKAVIEMASASGLTCLKTNELDPMRATTYGTGELILQALDDGCRQFLIGVGGSATNDGGAGIASALGASFLDNKGRRLEPGGGNLGNLAKIDISNLDKRLKDCEVVIASDINNILCGPNGASFVFARQKGATEAVVQILDSNLTHYINIVEKSLGKNIMDIPGSGAGGGTAAGLIAFCNAEIKSGIDIILDTIKFNSVVEGADLVITGEGKMDCQTLSGKAPVGVAKRAKSLGNIPVVAIVGAIEENVDRGLLKEAGIDAVVSTVTRVLSLEEAIASWERLVEEAAETVMRLIEIGMKA